MRDFAFIWLLFNTKTGKTILGIVIAYFIVMIAGWWLVPIIAALIGLVLLYDYFEVTEAIKKDKNRSKSKLIAGILLLFFALLFVWGYTYYNKRKYTKYYNSRYYAPSKTEDILENKTYAPDSVAIVKTEQPKSIHTRPSSTPSYSSSSVDDDNMRGWDPASEDDMDDNGMSSYMENTDDEGWD